MVEKKEGATMECLNCGNDLVCGWSKPSDTFKQKLQWQNKNGKAHYKYENGEYLCIGEDGEVIETMTKKDTKPEAKGLQPNLDKVIKDATEETPKRSPEQKVIDAIQMVELLWCPALEKAKEVYKISPDTKEPQTNKDVMILSQVFFKAMAESYLK